MPWAYTLPASSTTRPSAVAVLRPRCTTRPSMRSLPEAAVFGLGSGTGFALAVVLLSAVRTRVAYADLPAGLRGLGITFLLTGLMSLGFASFALMAAP